jgi:hypothetical protein
MLVCVYTDSKAAKDIPLKTSLNTEVYVVMYIQIQRPLQTSFEDIPTDRHSLGECECVNVCVWGLLYGVNLFSHAP